MNLSNFSSDDDDDVKWAPVIRSLLSIPLSDRHTREVAIRYHAEPVRQPTLSTWHQLSPVKRFENSSWITFGKLTTTTPPSQILVFSQT